MASLLLMSREQPVLFIIHGAHMLLLEAASRSPWNVIVTMPLVYELGTPWRIKFAACIEL